MSAHDVIHFIEMELDSTKPRTNLKFTEDEDRRLVKAIRKVVGMRHSPVSELPLVGVAWSAVADLMNNERGPPEYLARCCIFNHPIDLIAYVRWTKNLRYRLVYGNASELPFFAKDLKILEVLFKMILLSKCGIPP